MADKYWYGYGAGDNHQGEWNWDDPGDNADSNWRLCSDDSGCPKPADTDVVYIDSRAYYDTANSRYQDINANIDAAGTGTPDLAGFILASKQYNGIIGLPGEYLEIEADGDDIIVNGPATLYLKLSAGSGIDADCGRMIVTNSEANVYLKSLENDDSNVGLFAEIIALAGALTLADDTALTAIKVIGDNATVIAGTGCWNEKTDTAASIVISAGSLTWDSPQGGADVYGGVFNWGTDLATAEAGLDTDLVRVYPGGRFNWRCHDADVSILKKFIVYGGLLDSSQATSAQYRKQIGSGSGEISEVWPGGKLKLDSGNANLEFGSGSKIKNYGGVITAPSGENISW